MKNIQRRARMLIAALLAAVLLPWSGAVPASASGGGSILAEPYPNKQDVAYEITFTASETIPASSEGSLSVEFPAAYSLPGEASFSAGTDIISELTLPGEDTDYGYYDIVSVSIDTAAEAPAVQFGLSEAIPAGSAVTIRMWEEVGIDNPDSGSYTFYVGKADGELTAIPFEVISANSVAQFAVALDPANPANDNGKYFSNYSGYPDLSTYTFQFTPATDLSSGDHIQIRVPNQYSYDGAYFWNSTSVNLSKTSVTLGGLAESGALSSATTMWDDYGYPALSFTLAKSIGAGTTVAVTLSNFLITPDRLRGVPGPVMFEISTSKDPMPKTAEWTLFSRAAADFYPDASSYTVSQPAKYRFAFKVMQPILAEETPITITFPDGMTVPESIDNSQILIGTGSASPVEAASATVSGNQLIITSPIDLASFASVMIAIDSGAAIQNPGVPGEYTFKVKPAGDSLPAEREIGFIPAEGGSLDDSGHGRIETDNTLRFFFSAHTILKGGDTITIASPEGTLLTNPGISVQNVYLDPMEEDPFAEPIHPASVNRVSDNELTIELPAGYYLDPGYSFALSLPNIIAKDAGSYVFTIATSHETIPLAFSVMNDSLALTPYDTKRSQIDSDGDGLHMDDIVRFMNEGEVLDLNGDGVFNEDDMQILLSSIDPLSLW